MIISAHSTVTLMLRFWGNHLQLQCFLCLAILLLGDNNNVVGSDIKQFKQPGSSTLSAIYVVQQIL